MDILKYIVDEGLIMIPALYVLGEIIKNTELINNKWIPVILLIVSIGFTPLIINGYSADNIVQAILIAGATVYSNEFLKQVKKEK